MWVGKMCDFRQITRYTSKTVQDRQHAQLSVSMNGEYEVYALYQTVTLPMTLKPRLHDTAGCQTVVQPRWQPVVSCRQTSNRLSNRLSNRFDKHSLTTVLNEQPLFVQPVVKPGCTTGSTTGCIHDTAVCQNQQRKMMCVWASLSPVYTIQPVVKPVVKPDLQPGKWLYRVDKHPTGCQISCQTGLTNTV